MLGIMCMLVTMDAQASTIILKDGRTITGDIVQQDKIKVAVQDRGFSLTYYKDEISSIDGEPLTGGGKNTTADPEKGKLAEQYIADYPMRQMVSDWVKDRFLPKQQQIVLASLNNDLKMSALEQLRIQGVMQYFSSDELRAVIKFKSSEEGKEFFKHYVQYQSNILRKEIFDKLFQEAEDAINGAQQ